MQSAACSQQHAETKAKAGSTACPGISFVLASALHSVLAQDPSIGTRWLQAAPQHCVLRQQSAHHNTAAYTPHSTSAMRMQDNSVAYSLRLRSCRTYTPTLTTASEVPANNTLPLTIQWAQPFLRTQEAAGSMCVAHEHSAWVCSNQGPLGLPETRVHCSACIQNTRHQDAVCGALAAITWTLQDCDNKTPCVTHPA
jgi:hypothetical protein